MNSTPLRDLSAPRPAKASALQGAVASGSPPISKHKSDLLALSAAVPSWDPSLVGAAETADELFQVDPARANILRSLDIDSDSVVLEVGAGTGALSRYLAESVALLDAVEPSLELAGIAAARLAAFENARVFAGSLFDVPSARTYDLIVAVDQLRGSAGSADRWLARAVSLLTPGGSIVIAETNRLGAKFLVGAPDDSTDVIFDSIEGYPRGSSDPAFRRSELVALIAAAGLKPQVLVALPDHRLTRVVADASCLSGEHARLLADLALTPSPDYGTQRPKLADESRVWQQLVDEGLGDQLANSFVIVASQNHSRPLWGADRLAIYFSWQRAAEFTSQTVVDKSGDKVIFTRRYPRAESSSALRVHDSSYEFVAGSTLASAIAQAPDDQVRAWLMEWRELLLDLFSRGHLWLDLHPGNLIIGTNGNLVPIDLEFETASHDVDFAIRRGLLTVSRILALTTHPSLWSEQVRSVRDIGLHLGELMGYQVKSGWFDATIIDEAEFQETVAGTRKAGRPRSAWNDELNAVANTPLENLPLGLRVYETVGTTVAERDAAYARLGVFDDRIRDLEGQVRALDVNAILERDATITALEQNLAITRETLSRHISSLESRAQVEKESSAELETELRDELHHAHVASLSLQSSRTYRVALRLQSASTAAFPIGSFRRKLAARIVRAVRGGHHPT